MSASVATYTFRVLQGSTWDETVTLKNEDGSPIDLTGYEARMQVREDISSQSVILELSSATGEFIISAPTSGVIQILVAASVTELLPAQYDYQVWQYDLELFNNTGTVMRIMQGAFVVYPEVTRT